MEVKINKDIREILQTIFFGLSMRQLIFSVLACIVAVILYFLLRGHFGIETLSWACILGAVPFAVLGFVKYHGMTAEQFIWSWLKSKFVLPTHFCFKAENYYANEFKPTINKHLRRDFIKNKKEPKPKRIKNKKSKTKEDKEIENSK